jgi:lysophospholipase L1-like esterase
MLAGTRARLRGLLLAIGAASLLAIALSGEGAGAAADRPATGRPYLALGDSVVFGFITNDGFAYRNAGNFIGYPSYAGDAERLTTVNAACPGEATTSFISATGADNGCRLFKAVFPLHVAYPGTQLSFATSFLRDNPNTRLVTIGLGANDLFLLIARCNNVVSCVEAGLPAVLSTVGRNMDTIYRALRATRFHGELIAVTYYSLNYSDPLQTGVVQLLNQAISAHARADGVAVADAFDAFKTAASTKFAGGDTCRTGLLNASPQNQFTCDVHPSQTGQRLLAGAVEAAYAQAEER